MLVLVWVQKLRQPPKVLNRLLTHHLLPTHKISLLVLKHSLWYLHSCYECVYRGLGVLVDDEDLFAFLTNRVDSFVLPDEVHCEFLGLKVYLLLQLLEVV